MPISAAISAAGAIGGALIGSSASSNAANAQAQAQAAALAQQQRMFGVAQNALDPYITAGQSALPTLQSLLTPGANMSDILSKLPGFQFAQDWGQKATQNIGTTMGLGGNTLAAGAKYATGLAQQGYGQLVSQLQGFANTGAGAAGSLAGNAISSGQGQASSLGNIGNAQASGILGSANAISGGLGSIGNAFMLNRLFGGSGGGGGGIYAGANNAILGSGAVDPLAYTGGAGLPYG